MAYDIELARRVREIFAETTDLIEKKIFGGVCFFVSGNMACGILNDELIVRVGGAVRALLTLPGTRKFDITGRSMKGWGMVAQTALSGKAALARWVTRGKDFALTLPAKK